MIAKKEEWTDIAMFNRRQKNGRRRRTSTRQPSNKQTLSEITRHRRCHENRAGAGKTGERLDPLVTKNDALPFRPSLSRFYVFCILLFLPLYLFPFSVWLSVCLCLSLFLSHSVSFILSLSSSLILSLCFFLCFYLSVSISLFLSLCFYLSVSISQFLTLCFSHPFSLFFSLFLSFFV